MSRQAAALKNSFKIIENLLIKEIESRPPSYFFVVVRALDGTVDIAMATTAASTCRNL
jgi:hypothetical protein